MSKKKKSNPNALILNAPSLSFSPYTCDAVPSSALSFFTLSGFPPLVFRFYYMSVVRTISDGRRSGFRLRRSKLLVRSRFKDLGNNSNLFIFFAILSIMLMLLTLHKQCQLSSSIDQFNSRVSHLGNFPFSLSITHKQVMKN